MHYLARPVLVVALAWLLCACKTLPTKTNLSSESELRSGDGVVGFQVINNSHYVASIMVSWDSIVAERLDGAESEEFRLNPQRRGVYHNQIFLGAMPEGRYRISRFVATQMMGDTSLTAVLEPPRALGEFIVRAGRFTNLGSIIVQPYADNSASVIRQQDPIDLVEHFQSYYPDLAGYLESEVTIPWLPNETSDEQALILDVLQTYAKPSSAFSLENGSVLAIGTRMGVIYARASDGSWREHRTGHLNEITTIAMLDSKEILVGGDRGLILRAEGFEGPWEPIRAPVNGALILWLGQIDQGNLVAVTYDGLKVQVWNSENASRMEWRQVASVSYELESNDWFQLRTVAARSSPHVAGMVGDRLVLSVEKSIYHVDLDTGELERYSSPLVHRIAILWNDHIAIEPHMMEGNWWPFLNPVVSSNGGKKWKAIRKQRLMGLPFVFPDGSVGVAGQIPDINDPDREWTARSRWLVSPSWRHRWKVRSMMPECGKLYPGVSTVEELIVICETGQVFASRDGGKSWQVDRGIPDLEQIDSLMDAYRSRFGVNNL